MGIEIRKRQSLQAFITGSHAYGLPTPDSDIDLVLFVTRAEFDKLRAEADPMEASDEQYDANGSCSLRFSKLNLLCFFSEERFLKWKNGTEELKKQAPVSRNFAIRFLEQSGFK